MAGITVALVAGTLGTLFVLYRRVLRVPSKLRRASLVISPKGIALAQADLKGQMSWDEVREIKFVRHTTGKHALFGGLGGHGIVLTVPGAMIVIPDIYDRPLPLIHQLMLYYWSEEQSGEDPDRVWQFDAKWLEDTLRDRPERDRSADTGIKREKL
jgi:hypothetical protein